MTVITVPITVTVTSSKVTVAVGASQTTIAVPAAPVVVPPVSPPVIPPTGADNQNPVVVSNGKNNWTGNFNYSGAQEKDSVTAPDGSVAMSITGTSTTNTPPGGGGFQPYYQVPDVSTGDHFATAPYKFLVFELMPTQTGQSWSSGMEGANDQPIPGVGLNPPVESFGPVPTPGVWGTYKVPLGAGGFGLAGQQILKFNLQDQITAAVRLNNTYYIKTIFFSAT